MRKMIRRRAGLVLLGLPLLLLALGIAAPASAVGIFTLDAPVVIDSSNDGGTGVRGQFLVVTDLDLSDVLVSDGTVNFATQDVFLVVLELFGNSAPVDSFSFTIGVSGFGNITSNPKGAGALNDVASGAIAPSGVTADNTAAFAAVFDFSPVLNAGQETVRLFATYQSQGGGNLLAIGDTASFMVSSGTDFTVQGTIVPEPGTALLLAGGMLGLLGAARAASRRR